MSNPVFVDRDLKFKVKIKVGIRNCNTSREIVAPVDYETTVTPAHNRYSDQAALMRRCENMALEKYAARLAHDISHDEKLHKKLDGIEYVIFHKLVRCTEVAKELSFA